MEQPYIDMDIGMSCTVLLYMFVIGLTDLDLIIFPETALSVCIFSSLIPEMCYWIAWILEFMLNFIEDCCREIFKCRVSDAILGQVWCFVMTFQVIYRRLTVRADVQQTVCRLDWKLENCSSPQRLTRWPLHLNQMTVWRAFQHLLIRCEFGIAVRLSEVQWIV